ncbi:MAG TPA: 3-oxoacyl-ACP synthase [Thermoanaerobaculia bacterium]|nr:3-oxoacyl-ACP synthase [Thermoanaerobaculia bacterium]
MATAAEPGAGSRALAVDAANRALGAAGRVADEVEILVNAGVYRDENIVEPAMGPFIQRGIGANSTFPPLNGTRTFSFDLANGAGGPLTAIRVIDGFMRSGAVRSGLVVASDADPDPSRSENYPFAATGGAILLRATANGEGFAWFGARTWSEHFSLYEARLCGTGGLEPASEEWSARSQRLRFVQREDFALRAADCVGRTVEEATREGRLDPAEVELVIAAPGGVAFREALAERLRRAGVTAAVPAAVGSGAHTASTAFALAVARGDGSWERSRRILFVAAGAGITVSLALYER